MTKLVNAVLAALLLGSATFALADSQPQQSTASAPDQQTLTIYSGRFAIVQEVR
jgi:hypothetical protein